MIQHATPAPLHTALGQAVLNQHTQRQHTQKTTHLKRIVITLMNANTTDAITTLINAMTTYARTTHSKTTHATNQALFSQMPCVSSLSPGTQAPKFLVPSLEGTRVGVGRKGMGGKAMGTGGRWDGVRPVRGGRPVHTGGQVCRVVKNKQALSNPLTSACSSV